MGPDQRLDQLFLPFAYGPLRLANRFVLAPMTRGFCPANVPGEDVAAYYRRRAESGVGLLITEGTWIDFSGAAHTPGVPNFHGEEALAGWKRVVDEVHAAGGKIAPQLWHTGLSGVEVDSVDLPSAETLSKSDISDKMSPSGYAAPGVKLKEGMSEAQVFALIDAYARAAADAKRLGFDAVEIHGAHGYMVDQFLWHETNKREDRWGGCTLEERTAFAAEMVSACRERVGPDFPIIFRFSQWKLNDYGAKLANTPQEMEPMFRQLVDAGVDIFHASQRRFWEPEFEGNPLNLAGWAKKLSGKPSITVGSVGLETEFIETFGSKQGAPSLRLDELLGMFERGDFDLIAVGRALLADPSWVAKLQQGRFDEFYPWSSEAMRVLY